MWWILCLLLVLQMAMPRSVAGLCECGYSVQLPNEHEARVFTNLLESDFAESENQDISWNTDWARQEFNVSATAGRGRFGKTFLPDNIAEGPTALSPNDKPGLELRVESQVREDAISGAEMDSTRMDLHWGSYRTGMKMTDVNGTCAAFFWV